MQKKKLRITLEFGEGTPPEEVYKSTWFFIYQRVEDWKLDKWGYVEVPANKTKSALEAVRQYFKRHDKLKITFQVDKRKVDKGFCVIWFLKQERK